MNKLHYIFEEIDSDESFSNLAAVFNTTSKNDRIQIPRDYGSGYIKKIRMEQGLVMRVWDFRLINPILFHKIPHRHQENEKYFHIGYLLNTESIGRNNNAFPKLMHLPHGMNIVFFSSDADTNFEIDNGTGLHAIDLSVSYTWLMEAFDELGSRTREFITELNQKPYPALLLESSSPAEYRIISDIYTAVASDLRSHLHIKAEVLLLIAEFFSKISTRSSKEVLESKVLYYDKIIMAEKILEESLTGLFPGVDTIAKKVALSESTLKRYFKTVFNKSLNEYYLEIKMEYAKRLMLEKAITVNEVAALLNYEKVSSFIETFKKHHGYSPGHLKRKSA